MSNVRFTNNAKTKLAVTLSESDTLFSVVEGTGVLFPKVTTDSTHFYCTLVDTSGNIEIVRVINREDDTFTVERGAEGTDARNFPSDSDVLQNLTAQGLYDLRDESILVANTAIAIAEDANVKADEAKSEIESLATLPRTISITGDAVGGPITFNNRGNITVPVKIVGIDDSAAIFNRQVKTTSGEMLAPTSAIYTFRMCGGGGAGGGSHQKGGAKGGDTSVTVSEVVFTATGGSGGGGSGPNVDTSNSTGGSGGGGAGKVGSTQLYIPKNTIIKWTIGAGGSTATKIATLPTGSEAGINSSGKNDRMAGVGAVGAGSGTGGGLGTSTSTYQGGAGGNGAINGLGYGGGGGGAGGNGSNAEIIGLGGRGGEGGANGTNGTTTLTSSVAGGKGGNGVVIIEWVSRV